MKHMSVNTYISSITRPLIFLASLLWLTRLRSPVSKFLTPPPTDNCNTCHLGGMDSQKCHTVKHDNISASYFFSLELETFMFVQLLAMLLGYFIILRLAEITWLCMLCTKVTINEGPNRCSKEVPKDKNKINKRESQTQYLTRFGNLPTSSG